MLVLDMMTPVFVDSKHQDVASTTLDPVIINNRKENFTTMLQSQIGKDRVFFTRMLQGHVPPLKPSDDEIWRTPYLDKSRSNKVAKLTKKMVTLREDMEDCAQELFGPSKGFNNEQGLLFLLGLARHVCKEGIEDSDVYEGGVPADMLL